MTPQAVDHGRRITRASQSQCHAVADVLAEAFQNDPLYGWLVPDPGRRPEALQRFFAVEARLILPHLCSFVATDSTGNLGALLMLPPGHWRKPMHTQARHGLGYAGIFRRRLGHAFGMLTVLERLHPREPHFYLPYGGVVPAAQGQGVGASLLAEVERLCDERNLPAYLEASTADNARLYRRHGFVTLQQVTPLGAPPIELMLRRPNN
ncbi:GNAT family N-acetyltransferase [Mycobacterium sp. Aquia_213]|uniref:GNAT family N-acetyltransferase n=1 Tax=Mycobacterium sp. Aquia_213 TaxID=2991728 RepID=UPI002271B4B4|nr:GNAT family N-acetyltransferase [Mycobacterium sp. Aquia_213]WAC90177.1 GNAT family N-acetyltransferase [Mycobacterium sp. Aquia_213]